MFLLKTLCIIHFKSFKMIFSEELIIEILIVSMHVNMCRFEHPFSLRRKMKTDPRDDKSFLQGSIQCRGTRIGKLCPAFVDEDLQVDKDL